MNATSPLKVAVVIPARFSSTRLPGKPLAEIGGRAMICHVYDRAVAAGVGEVVVATDDSRIRQVVEAGGGRVVMTRHDHPSGTDRVAEAARSLPVDVVVNVQGDEPFLDPEMVRRVVEPFAQGAVMATLAHPLQSWSEFLDPNVVKVVCNRRGEALYFSRAPVPFPRDLLSGSGSVAAVPAAAPEGVLRHIGIYAYRADFLQTLASLSPTALERVEKLEQLRVLEHGHPIRVVPVSKALPGVDTPDDLERARNLYRKGSGGI
ncbi:MAG: 3-deoxy-manno-octulosonate cytidylyltransferase [Magnetococcales bacterium]|nr:3-deoxy-manno-octulosonate cytidylyltransferase [Magnetococcales bacterium]